MPKLSCFLSNLFSSNINKCKKKVLNKCSKYRFWAMTKHNLFFVVVCSGTKQIFQREEVQGGFFKLVPPQNCPSTGSHANWPRISCKCHSYKGISYLEKLGEDKLKKKGLYQKKHDPQEEK